MKSHPRPKTRPASLAVPTLALAAVLALAGCANGDGQEAEGPEGAEGPDEDSDPAEQQAVVATAEVADAQGEVVAEVDFAPVESGIEVNVTADSMEPGFYGFHLHQIGECEPESQAPDDPEQTGDFMSAGGHLPGEDGADHPDHAGDMPVLLVMEDGTAQMSVVTDRFDESMLTDDDGTAVVIHADEDNFAHVPDRYLDEGEDEPDEDTLATGDAGDRLACGVVEG